LLKNTLPNNLIPLDSSKTKIISIMRKRNL